MESGQLHVPNDPVIHYIEGDGIGVDITPVMMSVVDAAVNKAYNGRQLYIGLVKTFLSALLILINW